MSGGFWNRYRFFDFMFRIGFFFLIKMMLLVESVWGWGEGRSGVCLNCGFRGGK